MNDELLDALPIFGVTEVTGVQPSNGNDSGVTPNLEPEVTGVTTVADLLASATKPGEGEAQQDPIAAVPETERPCFRVYDGWTATDTGRKLRPGVWLHAMSAPKGGGDPAPVDTWICGPLHIEAQTEDGTGNNFGRLLRFKNTAGRWRTWAMPMELLRGSGEELRGELLAMGLAIDPNGRFHLARYLQDKPPKKRVRCALQVGWWARYSFYPMR